MCVCRTTDPQEGTPGAREAADSLSPRTEGGRTEDETQGRAIFVQLTRKCQKCLIPEQVVSLEKELNSLKIEGQEMSQCASALYVCLSRLSGELTDETERESAESVREKEEKVDDEKSR